MNIQINSLANANVYIDGVGLLGRAEEVEIPQPRHRMIDYKGLGMVGTAELWSGVDKLEAKIKWASFDAETLTMSASPFQTHSFQVRGSLEQYTSQGRSAELPVVYLMTGVFKDAGTANFKHQAMVETNSTVSVYHCELYVGGTRIYLYDSVCERIRCGGSRSAFHFPGEPGRLK